MRTHYEARDVRTVRLLHEYGFTDAELAEHLDLPPPMVRTMRAKLNLAPNGVASGIGLDRRRAKQRLAAHPAQRFFGGQTAIAGRVLLKFIDDRYLVPA